MMTRELLWTEVKMALNWIPNTKYPGAYLDTYALAAAITELERLEKQHMEETERFLGYKPTKT